LMRKRLLEACQPELQAILRDPSSRPAAGAFVVNALCGSGRHEACLRLVQAGGPESLAWPFAVAPFLESPKIAQTARMRGRIAAFLRKKRVPLRQTPVTWGAVGRWHIERGRIRRAARWFADWRERPDLPVHTLYNIAITRRLTNRRAEGVEALRKAVLLP